VRLAVAGQGDEGNVLAAGALDVAAAPVSSLQKRASKPDKSSS